MTPDRQADAPPPGADGRRTLRTAYVAHEYAVVGVVSSVLYIVIAVNVKVLLNWIVGPLWPVACMWIVPVLVRRATGWDDPLPGEGEPAS